MQNSSIFYTNFALFQSEKEEMRKGKKKETHLCQAPHNPSARFFSSNNAAEKKETIEYLFSLSD